VGGEGLVTVDGREAVAVGVAQDLFEGGGRWLVADEKEEARLSALPGVISARRRI
jgi:hypothetical protein